MSAIDTTLRGIRYESLNETSDRELSPMKQSEYDEDARWSWDAHQELHGQEGPDAPLIAEDRQSGAASPFIEPSQTGQR